MEGTLTIAALQVDCAPAPVSERLARVEPLIAEAAAAGARLVVLPELFNTGYEWHARNYALAEPPDGPTAAWMKAQAAWYGVHLAGSLILRDGPDIYNAALLVAPDGRVWRYDKHYVPLWERAYFRGGEAITVADTDLGRLGMMICWDQHHADLWACYAGQVDAVVVMSCSGDVGAGDLIFPDGYRAKFVDLVGHTMEESPAEETPSPEPGVEHSHQQAAWMGVPVVESCATGTVRTRLPLAEMYFPGSPLADRQSQAADMFLECGFGPSTQIVNARGEVLARGTATGDGVVYATVELPDDVPVPQGEQPAMNVSPEMYHISDELVPGFMLPLYQEGMRRLGQRPEDA